jgi:hypothetical protein
LSGSTLAAAPVEKRLVPVNVCGNGAASVVSVMPFAENER